MTVSTYSAILAAPMCASNGRYFMEKLKRDFGEYVGHVARHWVFLVSAVLFAILWAIQDIFDLDFPGWIWWAALLLGLHVAQFLAWRDVRNERNQLRRYNITQDVLSKIPDFRNEIVGFQNENPPDEMAVGVLQERYHNKRTQIISFLRESLTPTEAKLFETFGDYEVIALSRKSYLSMDHLNMVSQMIRDYRWLEKLAQDYSRQRFRPELIGQPEEKA